MALPATHPEPHTFGLYRARITDPDGAERRFRLLLFAEFPDRVHAELLSPLGAPLLMVDGGDGRLAVTFVREGESFVGRASASALERVVGVRIGLPELVRAILSGVGPGSAWQVERQGTEPRGLPAALELRGQDGVGLTLELKRLRPLDADPGSLGRGRAPEGTRVRPLRELAAEAPRIERLTDGGEP